MPTTTLPLPTFHVGHYIRLRREQLAMQQTELAELTGLGRTTIVNYENGHTRPSRAALKLLSNALDAPEQWLVSGQDDERPASDETGPGDTVRPKGFEPPTFCSVADLALAA